MNFVLVVYTAVAMAGSGGAAKPVYDWKTVDSFASKPLCEKAAKEMKAQKFSCLKKQ